MNPTQKLKISVHVYESSFFCVVFCILYFSTEQCKMSWARYKIIKNKNNNLIKLKLIVGCITKTFWYKNSSSPTVNTDSFISIYLCLYLIFENIRIL